MLLNMCCLQYVNLQVPGYSKEPGSDQNEELFLPFLSPPNILVSYTTRCLLTLLNHELLK